MMESATDPPPRRRDALRGGVSSSAGRLSAWAAWRRRSWDLPLVGYLLGSKKSAEHWVGLGRSEDFEPGATRLVTFENPIRQPWDGIWRR